MQAKVSERSQEEPLGRVPPPAVPASSFEQPRPQVVAAGDREVELERQNGELRRQLGDLLHRAELVERAAESQRLESIGRLAGGVAHDFNNLLTVILSCSEELRDGLAANTPIEPEVVDAILQAAERARGFTKQLLAFARKQVMAPVVVDLNALVREGAELIRRVVREDIEIGHALEPSLWLVRADPAQLDQVLVTLALNARDAMPGGGKLLFSTHNDPVGPRESADAAPGEGGPKEWVRLTVRDSGVGMPPEVIRHLFEPFFTTKQLGLGLGTGLGLATVHGVVGQLGGQVGVRSSPGQGTEISIWLPRETSASKPAPKAISSPGLSSRGNNERLLVVEDEPTVRAVTLRILREAGYRVEVAVNGRDALGLVAESPEPFDLVVTDVVMPELGGPALAEELWRLYPGQPVLFVSGYPRDSLGKAGELLAAVQFLGKPFTPAILLARVRDLLDRRYPPAP
jgi:signal transduction histidine kinase/CheY-like chemotaxis protein